MSKLSREGKRYLCAHRKMGECTGQVEFSTPFLFSSIAFVLFEDEKPLGLSIIEGPF